jgi:hypothetical protein
MTTTFPQLNLPGTPDAAPRLDDLAEQKRRIDEVARDYARQVQEGVRTLLGSAHRFEEGCRQILCDVAGGKAAEIHEARESILDAFQQRLALLFEAGRLGRHAQRLTERALPGLAELEVETGKIGGRLLSLSTRWQTLEDLKGLTEEKISSRVSPRELLHLPLEPRQAIMRRSAELAEEDYRTNAELLGFEAFGENDLYDDYPDAGTG